MGAPVMHFEIGCRDINKARSFYGELFNWKFQQFGDVTMIDPDNSKSIQGHMSCLGHEPHNYINVYVSVEDVKKHADRAVALGGKVIVPPTPVPGAGTFAWIADPQGTCIGLWQDANPSA